MHQLNLRQWRISSLAGTLDQRLDITRQPLNNFPTAVVQADYGLSGYYRALGRLVNRLTDELLSVLASRLMVCITSRVIWLRNLRRRARSNGVIVQYIALLLPPGSLLVKHRRRKRTPPAIVMDRVWEILRLSTRPASTISTLRSSGTVHGQPRVSKYSSVLNRPVNERLVAQRLDQNITSFC